MTHFKVLLVVLCVVSASLASTADDNSQGANVIQTPVKLTSGSASWNTGRDGSVLVRRSNRGRGDGDDRNDDDDDDDEGRNYGRKDGKGTRQNDRKDRRGGRDDDDDEDKRRGNLRVPSLPSSLNLFRSNRYPRSLRGRYSVDSFRNRKLSRPWEIEFDDENVYFPRCRDARAPYTWNADSTWRCNAFNWGTGACNSQAWLLGQGLRNARRLSPRNGGFLQWLNNDGSPLLRLRRTGDGNSKRRRIYNNYQSVFSNDGVFSGFGDISTGEAPPTN